MGTWALEDVLCRQAMGWGVFIGWGCFIGSLGGVGEKAMALHSSTLAWKIPWMEEPGRLQSIGSLRVGHD